MSSKVSGTAITMTRGDTLNVKVNIMRNDEEYIPKDGDVVRFALKHKDVKSDRSDFIDEEPLIIKTIPNDTMILTLDPDDTKSLSFISYVYDIEITFADGAVDTFITKSPFKITEEVH